tara:strand:+ start:550 stop:1131 length:582 start_codon:yes stop_codon:yes gene_type:complete
MKMRSLFCAALIYQSGSVPIYRSVRINYKIIKRKTARFVGPLYNRVISYDAGEYNENVQKNIKENYDLAKHTTERLFYERVEMIIKNQNEIIDRSVSIISDNVVNEFLYLMKVYHLTNDNINSYMYILAYEVLWVGYKLLRINTNLKTDITQDTEPAKKDMNLLYQQVIINIMLYILIKNLIMNSIINTLNGK